MRHMNISFIQIRVFVARGKGGVDFFNFLCVWVFLFFFGGGFIAFGL